METLENKIQQASARNKELLRVLSKTDYAPVALKEHSSFIADLKRQIKSNDSKIKGLERQRVLEHADYQKFRDSHFRRFMFKATGQKEKFDALAAKEEKEFYNVLRQQHQSTVFHNALKQQLDQAQKAYSEIEIVNKLHQDTQIELDTLYNSIFAGETPSFPEEDQLERDSDSALQHYHNTRVKHEEQTRELALLSEALINVAQVSHHLAQALRASRMDIFAYDGIADAIERSSLAKAGFAYREARNSAEQAHLTYLPNVDINQGHIMRDILFDNIFTDLQFHEEIRRLELEVKKFRNAILRGIAVQEKKQDAVAKQLKDAEKNLEDTRNKLQAERQRVFERVAREKKSDLGD